jgi:23S rRNA (uracil1939-C5)-methyltransferase
VSGYARAEITISKMGLEGQGVGTDAEGNIYFVPGMVVGDHVRVEFDPKQKRYRDIVSAELLAGSPSRVTPPCPYFQNCGGCDWLHWDYREQLQAKSQVVEHVFSRGSIHPKELRPIIGAEKTLGYRNRIQVRSEAGHLGFYRKKSHEIVDVESCAVADERLNETMRELRAKATPGEGRHKFELFLNPEGGITTVRDRQHAAGGFAQVHEGQNQKLQELVKKACVEGDSKNVLELFSGSGNLTYHYLDAVERVIAIDNDPRAIAAAIAKRPEDAAKKVAFFAMQVTPRLPRNLPPDFQNSYDTLILDPPRLGVGDFINRFVHPGLRRIIYVSCSPVSFSQDAQCLLKDFSLDSVQPIDMFPHTRHIELVGVFQRSSSL